MDSYTERHTEGVSCGYNGKVKIQLFAGSCEPRRVIQQPICCSGLMYHTCPWPAVVVAVACACEHAHATGGKPCMHAADRPTGMNHAHEQDEASRTHAMEKTQNRDIYVSFGLSNFLFFFFCVPCFSRSSISFACRTSLGHLFRSRAVLLSVIYFVRVPCFLVFLVFLVFSDGS